MSTKIAAAIEPISLAESRDLIRLESIVEKGLNTFVEVGEALSEIRDKKLYRIEHPTFDAYLDKKWNLSRSRACRIIQAAETVKVLPTGNKPQSERQARPLAALPPAQRAEVWEKAVAASPNGQPTAKDVQGVVETMNANPTKANVVTRQTASEPYATKTPLQWLTHYWMEASEEDRRMFDNFRAGLRGGRT